MWTELADKDFKVKSGLDLGTPLPLTEGGTGQTSANNALNALLPVQTSAANKFLYIYEIYLIIKILPPKAYFDHISSYFESL